MWYRQKWFIVASAFSALILLGVALGGPNQPNSPSAIATGIAFAYGIAWLVDRAVRRFAR